MSDSLVPKPFDITDGVRRREEAARMAERRDGAAWGGIIRETTARDEALAELDGKLVDADTDLAAAKQRLDTAEAEILDAFGQISTATGIATDAAIDARAAQSTAGTAQSTAASALTMAGTKGKVFYDTATPSGAGTSAGDLWRRIDAAKNVTDEWYWTGVAWQSSQITTTAISNLDVGKLSVGSAAINTLVSQKIAAASGQFLELDVGQLTGATGTLTELVSKKLWSDLGVFNQVTAGMVSADAIDGMIIRGVEIIGGTVTGGWVTTVPASNGVTASLGMVGEPGMEQYPGIGFNQGPAVFRPAGMVSRYGDDIVLQSREQTAGENYAALTLGPDYDGLGAAEIYATDRIDLTGPKTTILATTYIRLKTSGAVDFANIAGTRGDLTNVGTINGNPAPSADIPWARVPLQNSFTHYTEAAKWDGLRFTRRNRTLHINGAFTRTTSWATGQVIGTLTTDFRPTWRIKGQGCEIDPTGVIILTAAGSGPTTIEATVPLG